MGNKRLKIGQRFILRKAVGPAISKQHGEDFIYHPYF
jgi:hypothetical protein